MTGGWDPYHLKNDTPDSMKPNFNIFEVFSGRFSVLPLFPWIFWVGFGQKVTPQNKFLAHSEIMKTNSYIFLCVFMSSACIIMIKVHLLPKFETGH